MQIPKSGRRPVPPILRQKLHDAVIARGPVTVSRECGLSRVAVLQAAAGGDVNPATTLQVLAWANATELEVMNPPDAA